MERGGYQHKSGGRGAGRGGGGGGGRGPQRPQHAVESSRGGRGGGRGAGGRFHPQPQGSWQPRPNTSSFNQNYAASGRGRGRGSGGAPSNPIPPPSNPPPRPPQPQGSLVQRVSRMELSDPQERIAPVHRPDRGGTTSVRTKTLRVNHFRVQFNPKTIIMHYNVDVRYSAPPRQCRPPKKISKAELSDIRDQLFLDHPQRLPPGMTAYDGEKSIFSKVPLPEEAFAVDVKRGEDDRVVSYVVALTLVNTLELRKLEDYISGRAFSIPRDILQGVDLVFKENPTKRTVTAGRCFYPMNPPLVEKDLHQGIIAVGGFQHSLKPTYQGLSLCLDYSVLSFRKKMSVLEFLHTHIKYFNLREFGKFRKQVEEVLIGLKVTVTHRKTKQKYTVVKLTDKNARHLKFTVVDPDGQNPRDLGLLAYFLDKYKVDVVYKDIPALDFGGKTNNWVPMELCLLVEGQRYPKEQLGKDAARTLKDMTVAAPWVREEAIQDMVKSSDGPCGGGIIENFEMNVNTSMTTVTGRVIGPPKLKLRDPKGKIISMTLTPDKCQWNLLEKSMAEGVPVEYWGILDFTLKSRCNFDGSDFVPKLIGKYKKFGIKMNEPVWIEITDMWKLGNYNLLCELLEKINDGVQRKCRRRLQFLLCVMAQKDPGYKCLKWIAETKIGIVTQCCLSGNANYAKDQYLTNLALKINAKIGGSNVELNGRLPHFEDGGHVMFIGADVNHPGSRDTNSPSIAAVVASVNWPAANRYAIRVCAQGHRIEKILNFGEVCLELVGCYERLNKVRPQSIVIFRDGVSESQFQMVLAEELQDLKRVFQNSNYSPKITLIVAQKRHQTRLFPAGESEGTPSGNVLPGTVVDTEIIHPFEFDFYLVSHYGSLGTSKPTHYHVLWDEHNFTSDKLQKLIYDLCFTFARCTKPVSLVPPVYYADLAAYRGRLYHEAMVGVQSPYSGVSSSSSPMASSLSSTSISGDPDCYKLHADVEIMCIV